MIPYWKISTRFLLARTIGLVLVLGVTSFLIFASEQQTHACICAQTPLSEDGFVIEYDAIFAGTVVAERPYDGDYPSKWVERVTYEIRVSTVWKGPANETMFVSTSSSGASCGQPLEVGEEVLLYASAINNDQEDLRIGLCDPGGPIYDWEAVLERLGPGLQLIPRPSDESQSADAPKPPATGGCNIVAQTALAPVDASLIGLIGGIVIGLLGGIVWFRARKYQNHDQRRSAKR